MYVYVYLYPSQPTPQTQRECTLVRIHFRSHLHQMTRTLQEIASDNQERILSKKIYIIPL